MHLERAYCVWSILWLYSAHKANENKTKEIYAIWLVCSSNIDDMNYGWIPTAATTKHFRATQFTIRFGQQMYE